jgi:hypothetical protein
LKQFNLSNITYIKEGASQYILDDLMTKHICVTNKDSLDPLLAVYPELNRYNFFDARFKVNDLLNIFDHDNAFSHMYCSSKEKDLAVA